MTVWLSHWLKRTCLTQDVVRKPANKVCYNGGNAGTRCVAIMTNSTLQKLADSFSEGTFQLSQT